MHEDKKWEYVEKEAIERENNMIKVGQSSTVSGCLIYDASFQKLNGCNIFFYFLH